MVSSLKKIYIFAGVLIVLHLMTVSGLLYSITRILAKTDRIYEYTDPANLAIARLETLHEIRMNRLLLMMAAKDQASKDVQINALKSSDNRVTELLDQMKRLDHEPPESALVDTYIKMRDGIRSAREGKIIPLSREGKDAEAFDVLIRDFLPLFETRRDLALEIQDNLAKKNENIHLTAKHMLKNTGMITVVILVMTIIGTIIFCYMFTKMMTMEKQKEKQADQMAALRATMNRVQDIVLNSINQTQLFFELVSDRNNELSTEDMQMFKNIIDDTAEQIKKIGNLEKFETCEITKGMTTIKVDP